ncbi:MULTISPECIES: protein-L-isoaspartate O-methyltransferase [Halobacterium]|uniref:protein-L-isoaspartate(D-aspartate) O-methyltransferase n=2 Tax=Halobacterium salinarum TaxID=2242 RepID=A0A4D6GQT2_HALS9|nr:MULTISPECIES: protein-L-isoaspartate O-methyltransferase [Halobacterium]MDL0126481.1 protein-L-isoaspartate O-methyltransferase [Halobacterium salinarum]QCC44013.1 protein-L-isoaspartate O-methyltransferase [Halobacterium salinarum]QRY24880.1 protein-L-isoaspartate O-methyltransferase [Halobacterium sp. BOL4-2]TYO76941.1 protein-L-isoaspartate(D-aspartate) O-methyltransferase [Halobacterium salinarum DSM 3754]
MEFGALREEMVDSLLDAGTALADARPADAAMRAVPRHEFVDAGHRAYTDQAFEHRGTRVLAPSTVARLMGALEPRAGDDVLVVGAGVGYTVAVLAEIAGPTHVHAVDIDRQVVYDARGNLADAGYEDVLVDCRDGAEGLAEYAPFDRVLVEAGAASVPDALARQLAADGRLVFPEGVGDQRLVSVRDGETVGVHGPVSFAPLLVAGEQASAVERNRTVREDRERVREAAQSRPGWEREWIDWEDA